MNRKFFPVGLSGFLLLVSGCATELTDTVPVEKSTPLKQLVMVMGDKRPIDIDKDSERYLNIKGIKWDYQTMQKKHPPRFSNNGYIELEKLGQSEISLNGNNKDVTDISIFSSEPNSQFRDVLAANLGSEVVIEELKNECQIIFSSETQKMYQIHFKDKQPVYVFADANLSSGPSMSPLYTNFAFYKEIPEHWGCKF